MLSRIQISSAPSSLNLGFDITVLGYEKYKNKDSPLRLFKVRVLHHCFSCCSSIVSDMLPFHFHLIAFLLASCPLTAQAQQRRAKPCFWPDKSSAPEDTPCDPNAEDSMCCGPTDICLSNKMCYVANINGMHRGVSRIPFHCARAISTNQGLSLPNRAVRIELGHPRPARTFAQPVRAHGSRMEP